MWNIFVPFFIYPPKMNEWINLQIIHEYSEPIKEVNKTNNHFLYLTALLPGVHPLPSPNIMSFQQEQQQPAVAPATLVNSD